MSPNTHGSVRQSSPKPTAEGSDCNLSTRKPVVIALLAHPASPFSKEMAPVLEKDIAQESSCFENHNKMSDLFAKNTKCLC